MVRMPARSRSRWGLTRRTPRSWPTVSPFTSSTVGIPKADKGLLVRSLGGGAVTVSWQVTRQAGARGRSAARGRMPISVYDKLLIAASAFTRHRAGALGSIPDTLVLDNVAPLWIRGTGSQRCARGSGLDRAALCRRASVLLDIESWDLRPRCQILQRRRDGDGRRATGGDNA